MLADRAGRLAGRRPDDRPTAVEGHGSHCSCRALAAALGCDADTIRFTYCRGVLMRHWSMTCDHVGRPPPPHPDAGERWHAASPIDPVKAILIDND